VSTQRSLPHPYIPNAIPDVKAAMLAAVDAATIDEFYADIPRRALAALPTFPRRCARGGARPPVEAPVAEHRPERCSASSARAATAPRRPCDEINGRSEFLVRAGEP
jgi:glycine dehydrogenase subunit 1